VLAFDWGNVLKLYGKGLVTGFAVGIVCILVCSIIILCRTNMIKQTKFIEARIKESLAKTCQNMSQNQSRFEKKVLAG